MLLKNPIGIDVHGPQFESVEFSFPPKYPAAVKHRTTVLQFDDQAEEPDHWQPEGQGQKRKPQIKAALE
jgi:hypothetical protein